MYKTKLKTSVLKPYHLSGCNQFLMRCCISQCWGGPGLMDCRRNLILGK